LERLRHQRVRRPADVDKEEDGELAPRRSDGEVESVVDGVAAPRVDEGVAGLKENGAGPKTSAVLRAPENCYGLRSIQPWKFGLLFSSSFGTGKFTSVPY